RAPAPGGAAMRLGNMIADAFAFLLLACLVGGIFLAFGKPFWREHQGQMAVPPRVGAFTTASVGKPPRPDLPQTFDLGLAPSKPGHSPGPRTGVE
ncbi:hypothetical protein, partial [Mesorhizobium sp.]|uniref:hypothetical protein n=2 Tax=unclassified Mesorhizobium TaxID=325217 RepID=UPI0025C6F9DF